MTIKFDFSDIITAFQVFDATRFVSHSILHCDDEMEVKAMKFAFFDLDGTLRETKSGERFINKPDDQQSIPGANEALAYYFSEGFHCIGITNQGGVAAGHKSLDDAIKEQQITLDLFPELSKIFMSVAYDSEGSYVISRFEETYFDAGQPGYLSRKPAPGMILSALRQAFGTAELLFSEESFMVGDRLEDCECAKACNLKFIWASDFLKQFTKPRTVTTTSCVVDVVDPIDFNNPDSPDYDPIPF
ncbi:MAG TPA: HAD-IIIA family hydrolase [Kamptonema sp.]|nr:HAD-IIIA family hydrolase [Kamptonema sp.]